jgi:hypothetical protein
MPFGLCRPTIHRPIVCRWCIIVVETKKEPNKHISIIEMEEKEKYSPLAQTERRVLLFGSRYPPFVIPSFVDGVLKL